MINPKLFVKICGITREEDAVLAARFGTNAIGMIFYPESKRFITFQTAVPIARAAKASGISRVGVFVNPGMATLELAVQTIDLDFLQLHGNESREFVAEVRKKFPGHKIIKAIRLGTEEADFEYASDYDLLDHQSKEWGGTGQIISWGEAQKFVASKKKPTLLAGGLTPDNIFMAVQSVTPAGVDLSSGVEITPGIKSEEKIRKLFQQIGRS